ncbi:MAG: zinc ribbon domain-containing protein [Acidimicrobiales bacterium]
MAADTDTKVCPQCAEEIKARAQVCHFCGAQFDVVVQGRCPTCGSAQAGVDGRCPACGAELVDVTVQSTPRPPTPTPGMPAPGSGAAAIPPTAPGPVPPTYGSPPGTAGPGPAAPAYGAPTWGAGPALPAPGPAKSPRKGGCLTPLFWVVGVVALLVGLGGLGLARAADSSNETTFATELQELKGDLTTADTQAAEVKARTSAVADALRAYTASLDAMQTSHEAITDTVNRSVDAHNAGNDAQSVAIANSELPATIDAYQKALEDQQAKQAALAAAVAKLQEVTP